MIGQFFLVTAAAFLTVAVSKRYDDYQLIRIYPVTEKHFDLVTELSRDVELDFWKESRDHIDILVPPDKLDSFESTLDKYDVNHVTRINNLQVDIDEETARLANRESMAFNYDDFNTLADIYLELDAMAARCPVGVICRTSSIGYSIEGREIRGLKMYKNETSRQAIWLEATTHAREWLGTATQLKIMSHLIDDYATDPQVQYLVDTYDWYFFPVINPDGYNFTWQKPDGDGDRFWRKNRRINNGTSCIGVDLNRNYDQMWGNAGADPNPCGEVYRGESPASEPETQAVQAAIDSVSSTLLYFVSFHTYGQLWLIPWGSFAADGISCNIAADDAEMMVVANAAADAIQATYNTTWLRGNSCKTIYPASGLTMDYAKGVSNVTYTVTPELRGGHFIVMPDQIAMSFDEVWNGLTTAITAIENAAK